MIQSNWSKKKLAIDSVLKTNLWTYKTKDLKGEKKEVFMKKNCCGVYYKWVIVQNQTVILDIKLK